MNSLLVYAVRFTGFLLIVWALWSGWQSFKGAETEAMIFESVPTQQHMPTQLSTPTYIPTVIPPTPTPIIQGFQLGGMIDLSGSKLTTWSIRLPEGGELPGTWAKAIAFEDNGETQSGDPFDPHAGTIYSLFGDTVVVQAHSGQILYRWDLFASGFDLYLR